MIPYIFGVNEYSSEKTIANKILKCLEKRNTNLLYRISIILIGKKTNPVNTILLFAPYIQFFVATQKETEIPKNL